MKKIKIAFLAPEMKWGPFYIYKDISDWLKKEHWNELDIHFFNSKLEWVKLHFIKYDFIFSVIPFLFKPLWVKKYIFNLHGNYNIEKNRRSLWNKLLYLAESNLRFSDKIMISSLFLAKKLNFINTYKNKIFILPNPVYVNNTIKIKSNHVKDVTNILTVSSTKFLEKWIWIIDLWKQLSKIKDLNLNWTIIAGGDIKNKNKLLEEFWKINFWENIKYKWLDWIEKDNLPNYYNKTDIFLYGTRLDSWWGTILEAMSYNLPIILLEYELWEYIYPKEIITNNIDVSIRKILGNYEYHSKLSADFVIHYKYEKIIKKIFNFIINNNVIK